MSTAAPPPTDLATETARTLKRNRYDAANETLETLGIVAESLQSPFMQLAHARNPLLGRELHVHPPHHAVSQLDLFRYLIHRLFPG